MSFSAKQYPAKSVTGERLLKVRLYLAFVSMFIHCVINYQYEQ